MNCSICNQDIKPSETTAVQTTHQGNTDFYNVCDTCYATVTQILTRLNGQRPQSLEALIIKEGAHYSFLAANKADILVA